MLSIIVAAARNGAIGLNGALLYHLRADLQRFKALTTGHTIIMGRRTFESLPKGALPNRRNIVLTRQAAYSAPGIEVFASLQEALAACAADDETFVIGGESVYAEALPLARRLYLTRVEDTPPAADAFFPPFDEAEWRTEHSERHDADERNDMPYTFIDYCRK